MRAPTEICTAYFALLNICNSPAPDEDVKVGKLMDRDFQVY